MTRLFISGILLAGLIFCGGCRKTTPDNPETILTSPADEEEAALQVVGNLYGFYAAYHKKGPTGWDDLKDASSNATASAQKEASDAIQQVQAAGFKMTWGVDKPLLKKEGIKADDYVIAESADGLRKLMFSGNVKTTKPETKKDRQN
ncbi:MAG: hypothetical protein K0U86_04100 [Planctomycetes bacterium]|nr:hypothetical protein [Planctomycetota bacterium]MCH9724068.1 hypothetical protein [Planctomycetota bacterium]MCH9778124.1 hypothetical protein [Planctomycetota bacterium]MCH9790569.1 hypothetical protein [Planctomycetota bacterium]MDF1745161.1 hypothetical protein [Gimesia sp.]